MSFVVISFFKPQEHLFFCLMLKYFKRRISACCFNLWLVDKEVRFGTAFWSFMCNNIRDKIISSGKTEENKKPYCTYHYLFLFFSVLFWVDIASGLGSTATEKGTQKQREIIKQEKTGKALYVLIKLCVTSLRTFFLS